MLSRMIGEIYRSPSRLAKMSFEERRKLVSTFFAGRDAQGRRLGVYLERDKKTGAVKYEIRGVFGKTFLGEVTPDGLDILNFKDISVEHLKDLKEAIKSKPSRSDRPYHAQQDIHGKDLRNDPQVEQWVA